jgi:phage baseplate assembly protein W
MATQLPPINPLDLNANSAIGVSLPFNGSAVFNSTYDTNTQLRSNIINFLLTDYDERVYQPNFGSNLRQVLFEGITESNLKALEPKIAADIENNFPSVRITNLTLSSTNQEYAVQLNINYSVFGSNTQNIQITF